MAQPTRTSVTRSAPFLQAAPRARVVLAVAQIQPGLGGRSLRMLVPPTVTRPIVGAPTSPRAIGSACEQESVAEIAR